MEIWTKSDKYPDIDIKISKFNSHIYKTIKKAARKKGYMKARNKVDYITFSF